MTEKEETSVGSQTPATVECLLSGKGYPTGLAVGQGAAAPPLQGGLGCFCGRAEEALLHYQLWYFSAALEMLQGVSTLR